MSINTNNTINNIYNAYMSQKNVKGADRKAKADEKNKVEKMPEMKDTSYGKTVGNVKLSKEAEEYYKELKEKFSDLDFVLVSTDDIDKVNENPYGYASDDKTTIIIDADKIEKMATDEDYRKKMEGVIVDAVAQLDEMMKTLEESGQADNIVNCGISVSDDGTAQFFAVLKKSSEEQKARMEEKAAEKKEAKKAEDKKAEIKKAENKKAESKKAEKKRKDETETLTANSIEELMKKIGEFNFNLRSDSIMTEEEKAVGQNFDFNV